MTSTATSGVEIDASETFPELLRMVLIGKTIDEMPFVVADYTVMACAERQVFAEVFDEATVRSSTVV